MVVCIETVHTRCPHVPMIEAETLRLVGQRQILLGVIVHVQMQIELGRGNGPASQSIATVPDTLRYKS
jgi:hypothetical protein